MNQMGRQFANDAHADVEMDDDDKETHAGQVTWRRIVAESKSLQYSHSPFQNS
jgi:hypothetical protein